MGESWDLQIDDTNYPKSIKEKGTFNKIYKKNYNTQVACK